MWTLDFSRWYELIVRGDLIILIGTARGADVSDRVDIGLSAPDVNLSERKAYLKLPGALRTNEENLTPSVSN